MYRWSEQKERKHDRPGAQRLASCSLDRAGQVDCEEDRWELNMEATRLTPAGTVGNGLARSTWSSVSSGVRAALSAASGSVRNVSERTITLSEPPLAEAETSSPRLFTTRPSQRIGDPNILCLTCGIPDSVLAVSTKTGRCVDCELGFELWLVNRKQFRKMLKCMGMPK